MKYWVTFKMVLFALCLVVFFPIIILLSLSGMTGLGERIMDAMGRFVDELYEAGGVTKEEYDKLKESIDTH